MTISWRYPVKPNEVHRIEVAFIALVSVLIFIGSSFYFEEVLYPLLFVGVFLLLYVFSARIVRLVQYAEEHYVLHPTHLEIHRQRGVFQHHVTIPWRNIKRHKLDRFFLGGYIVTAKKERHPLFFNTKKELERFEKFVQGLKK